MKRNMSKRPAIFGRLTSLIGIAALAAVIGLDLAGCPMSSDDSDDGEPKKTIIIQGIPANVYSYSASGGEIGIFPIGTTDQDALAWTGIVAVANLQNEDVDITPVANTYTVTFPLYNISNNSRWTGKGTFTVYMKLNGDGGHHYKVDVSITSGRTTVFFSNTREFTPSSGKPSTLSRSASAAQALEALDAIIAYPDTPAEVKLQAEALKITVSSNSGNWESLGTTVIDQINGIITVLPEEDKGGDSKKTLVIQGIPANVYSYGASGGEIGIFPIGTTDQDALARTGIVAGANLKNE
ncbi:MAG: hypothetical protein LBS57_03800, partial [Treponema sp.]|nr:hypothetical protein [Treponema sp.]